MSPDAKYVYYKFSENDSAPVYGQFFFHNLDTDEVTAFGELDYQYVRGFDVNGNVLLEGDDELTLYNIESEETRIIPEVEVRSEEHTSELQSRGHLVCRLLLEKKNQTNSL